MKRPTFLIIGAARSGTTALAGCLSAHPQIYLSTTAAEPKFFSREQEYEKGTDHYLQTYFRDAGGYTAVGEKSTEYMENQRSAERIFIFEPGMKLIGMLRNPVERAISNYWWSVQNGVENRPLETALRGEWESYMRNPVPIVRLNATRPRAYIDRSLYYDNLLPFYSLFPASQIRCIIYEAFIEDQQSIASDLYVFLGVSPSCLAKEHFVARRAAEKKTSPDPALYGELWNFFKEKNARLSALIGIDVWRFWHIHTR